MELSYEGLMVRVKLSRTEVDAQQTGRSYSGKVDGQEFIYGLPDFGSKESVDFMGGTIYAFLRRPAESLHGKKFEITPLRGETKFKEVAFEVV